MNHFNQAATCTHANSLTKPITISKAAPLLLISTHHGFTAHISLQFQISQSQLHFTTGPPARAHHHHNHESPIIKFNSTKPANLSAPASILRNHNSTINHHPPVPKHPNQAPP
jgi:hypothetical protein